MDLKPGDKVLLLLQSSTTEFVAQWQGPYEVTRRAGKLNYEILMPDKGGHKQIFHINYLKKWKERKCNVKAVIEDGDGLDEYYWSHGREMQYGEQLTSKQREDIDCLLSRFPYVTKKTPGRTDRTIHKIRAMDITPIRQKPYKIPQAYKEKIMKEWKRWKRMESLNSQTVSGHRL